MQLKKDLKIWKKPDELLTQVYDFIVVGGAVRILFSLNSAYLRD